MCGNVAICGVPTEQYGIVVLQVAVELVHVVQQRQVPQRSARILQSEERGGSTARTESIDETRGQRGWVGGGWWLPTRFLLSSRFLPCLSAAK